MFVVETFLSMLFVKCKSRGEQLAVVIGMLVLIVVCVGIGKFLLGMGEAGADTFIEMSSSDGHDHSDFQRGSGEVAIYGYAGAALCALLGIIFAIMAGINLVRFITRTGLADPDEGWS